jgi:hypothetical protein
VVTAWQTVVPVVPADLVHPAQLVLLVWVD